MNTIDLTSNGLEQLKKRIVDAIASRAQAQYVEDFNAGPLPNNPDRINSRGQAVNYKKTVDADWIEAQKQLGLILSGEQALEKPQGGIIFVDGVFLVDIGNRLYQDLPKDLQALNQASAIVAADQMILGAAAIHDAWVVNNSWQIADVTGNDRVYGLKSAGEIYAFVLALPDDQRQTLELFVPFDQLPEIEQNKDFVFMVNAAGVIDGTISKDAIGAEQIPVSKVEEIAAQVHDQWVMGNLRKIEEVTGDSSVYELESVEEVYSYVSIQSEVHQDRLSEFVPFHQLPANEQSKSLMFVGAALSTVRDDFSPGDLGR